MDKLFTKITVKQEAITYTLIVPILVYFLALFLPFIKTPVVLVSIVVMCLVSLILGNILKSKKIGIYEKYLNSESENMGDKETALKNITRLPFMEAWTVAVRWFIAGGTVATVGYVYAGATPTQIAILVVFMASTTFISMPIFYLLAEKEVSQSIMENNDRFTGVDKEIIFGLSIRLRLLWTIVAIVVYVTSILTTLLYLSSKNIFQVDQQLIGLIIFITDTFIIAVITGLLFVNGLRKRLSFIQTYIKGISMGKLTSIAIDSHDEFGHLLFDLNNMGTNLKHKQTIVDNIASGDGDFTVQVDLASSSDEFGLSLQRMLYSLNHILSQVDETVKQVTNGSNQISIASQNLSAGAETQASAAEETSSAITDLSKEMLDNANQADEARELVNESADNARKGKKLMEKLIQTIENSNNNTQKIQEINKLIDSIAFQINLLALNANVEAARAGKYGRGFAVVADEVRNLANRSSTAVKETSFVIDATVKNIKEMNSIIKETANQLKIITTNTEEASGMVDYIASNCLKESSNLKLLMDGLQQISQVSQSNSASSQETAASTEELAAQATLLNSLIGKFKLSNQMLKDMS